MKFESVFVFVEQDAFGRILNATRISVAPACSGEPYSIGPYFGNLLPEELLSDGGAWKSSRKMRKVVVYELMSLDGVAEDPDSFITDWDRVMDANLATVIEGQDAVILGRRTYDEWARFWSDSDIQPFSTFINKTKKYVATSKAIDFDWVNSTAIAGDVVDFVRDLKSRPGSDIGVHASISVAQNLLRAGVVDELHLVIAPWIAGVGRKLFDGLPAIPLALIQSSISPTGYLLLNYVVTK